MASNLIANKMFGSKRFFTWPTQTILCSVRNDARQKVLPKQRRWGASQRPLVIAVVDPRKWEEQRLQLIDQQFQVAKAYLISLIALHLLETLSLHNVPTRMSPLATKDTENTEEHAPSPF